MMNSRPQTRAIARHAAASVTALWLAAGCNLRAAPDASERELRVFAASSLCPAFQALKQEFERAQPDVRVLVHCAGSQTLRVQIEQGAPAHLFAAAHVEPLERLASQGRASEPHAFAHNRLALIVPSHNPAGLTALAELGEPARKIKLVVAAPQVPAGRYTHALLERAAAQSAFGPDFAQSVDAHVVSRESSVRRVLTKVSLGNADAGFVYASDAHGDPSVVQIPLPEALQPTVAYYSAPMLDLDAQAARDASTWDDFVAAPSAQRTLQRFGLQIEAPS